MSAEAAEAVERALAVMPDDFHALHPDDRADAITDLLTDLLLLAAAEGFEPELLRRRAWSHYEAERGKL